MASIRERIAALNAAKDDSSRPPAATTPPATAGAPRQEFTSSDERDTLAPEVHEGPLKKAGTGLLSAVVQNRWCVLHSDGTLVVFDDKARTRQKASLTLSDVSTVELSGADTLLVRVPPGGRKGVAVEHRFRAPSAEQAEAWLRKLHEVQLAVASAAGQGRTGLGAAPPPQGAPAAAACAAAAAATATKPLLPRFASSEDWGRVEKTFALMATGGEPVKYVPRLLPPPCVGAQTAPRRRPAGSKAGCTHM